MTHLQNLTATLYYMAVVQVWCHHSATLFPHWVERNVKFQQNWHTHSNFPSKNRITFITSSTSIFTSCWI